MDKQIITFSANEQNLVRIGGEYHYSSNKVSYIGAHFDLGANWDGFDSVRAVWFTDRINGISTVLDGEGNCTVPTEVLKKKDRVFVNLVGSIVSNGELTDRLTTYPAVALVVDSKAKVDSTETAPVTPSQFEQFVSIVQDAVANIKDIVSTTLNADYTLTFVYSDGTSYTTPSIRGERGPQGADGADGTDGNGIASAVLNSNYTLTLTFTDGTSYTTPSIRGAQGPKGDPGDVSQAQLDAAVSDLKSDLRLGYEVKNVTTNGSFGASGLTTGATNRIRTDLIPFSAGDKITIDNGSLQHACGMWQGSVSAANIQRNDDNFSASSETITATYNGYLVVVFRNSSNTALSPTDFDGSVKAYLSNQVKISENLDNLQNITNQLNTREVAISQGYWAIADGTFAASANWCRTDAYIPKNYRLKSSSILMFLLAYSNGVYVGMWDRTAFTQVYNASAHMEDIDMAKWSKDYPTYQFKIDFYSNGSPITPADCQSSLSITTTEESIEARVETLETDLIPATKLKQFSTNQNLLPFVEQIGNKYAVGVVGNLVQVYNNASYTTWIVPVEQTTYYMTSVTWWALVDSSGIVLAGSGINGNTITSLDVSQYPTAKTLYYSRSSTDCYLSTTNGGSANTFRLDGLVADADIPNNNVFDIPSFTYITGTAWDVYFAGGWLRNAEYKRTSNGYKQYDDHFSYMASSAGVANSTIRLYDNNFDSVGMHTMSMNYAVPSHRNATAMFIGDSTINNGGLTAKVLEVFAEKNVTCTLLGTRGAGANKHEGRSGWTAKDYCGLTTRGQDVSQNPFYNPSSQTFDFGYYMSQQGYSDPEFVFIQLGINDMFSVSMNGFADGYNAFKTNMLTIIESIHSYNANIKIVVNLITMPNGNTSAYNTLYGCSYYNWERRYVDILTNSRLITDVPSYVLLNPHNLILDPMTNITDDVHPTAEGYAILGEFDANYMFAN